MWTITEGSSTGLDDRLVRFSHDIYHKAVFHEYDYANGHGEICQYWYEDKRGALLHTFLLRRIHRVGNEHVTDPLFDAETVRGAAGPLATSLDYGFLADAWRPYQLWCEQNRVIAEYVRFNPFIGNATAAGHFFSVRFSDYVGVAIDLQLDGQQTWLQNYNSTQRKNVRKAQRLGITCELASSAGAFEKFVFLQRASWERLAVAKERQYTNHCLYFLRTQLGQAAPLFVARFGDQIVAASLFLTHNNIVHYQLSARDPTCGNTGASNLILHMAAQWAKQSGFKIMHLGTGRAVRPDDELLRFKACMSPERVRYYCGIRYHLPEQMNKLCALWLRQAPRHSLGQTSMPYREPIPIEEI